VDSRLELHPLGEGLRTDLRIREGGAPPIGARRAGGNHVVGRTAPAEGTVTGRPLRAARMRMIVFTVLLPTDGVTTLTLGCGSVTVMTWCVSTICAGPGRTRGNRPARPQRATRKGRLAPTPLLP
jgi:hypothetical protein